MAIPLNIIFIELAQADMDLLSQALRDADYAPQAVVLPNLSELPKGLTAATQVLVVNSWHEHPQKISQVSALLRERMLDVPLFIYAQSGSFESIIDALQAGAQDFISTENPQRIVSALQRELSYVELRAEQREQIVTDYLLQEIDALILQAWDVEPLVSKICQRVIELFDLRLAWIGEKQSDGFVKVLAAAGQVDYLQDIVVRWDDSPQGNGTGGRSIKTGQPVVLAVTDHDFAPWRERAQRFGIRSIVALPMIARGEVLGTLMLYSEKEQVFNAAAIKRYAAFAKRIAVALLVTQEQQQLRLLRGAMDSATNAMFVTEKAGTIVWFNEALSLFSGYSFAELLGATPQLFNSGVQDAAFWKDFWASILQGKAWRGEVVNRRKDGSLLNVVQNVTPLFDNTGQLTHFLAVQQDVTEMKELEREVQFLAYHDVLTGLPNRVLFNDRMQQAISQSKRDQAEFALLFIDLDGFKEVNDTYGHAAGDRLLQIAADRLRACVRAADTVARLGGDEFTVLLREVNDSKNLQRVAGKILKSIAAPYDLGEYKAVVTASIGISRYPKHALGTEKLMNYADEAMYQAKQSGKNRCVLYQKN